MTKATPEDSHDRLAVGLRFLERVLAIGLTVWLMFEAIDRLPEAGPAAGGGEIALAANPSGLELTLKGYGPTVVLVALAVAVMSLVFIRRWSKTEDKKKGTKTQSYAEPPAADTRPTFLVEHDKLEELLASVEEVRRRYPGTDAADRLSRAYEDLYDDGRLDEVRRRRLEALSKIDAPSAEERREEQELRARYPERLAPPWRS